jgi:polysaccharide biosynthesis transport protein
MGANYQLLKDRIKMNSFEFGTLHYEARRYWWLLLLGLLMGAGIGYWKTASEPPIFTSEARMLVSGKITLTAGTSASDEAQETSDFLLTQVTIIQSPQLRSRAEKNLIAAGHLPPEIAVNLSATFIPRTTIFLLKASGSDQAYTHALLQETVREFIAFRKELRLQRSDDTASALSAELVRVQQEAAAASRELNDFQKTFNNASLEDEQSADTAYLATLRKRLAELRLEQSVALAGGLDTAVSSIATKGSDNRASIKDSDQKGLAAESLLAVKENLATLEASREHLLSSLRSDHPKIRLLNLKIAEANAAIRAEQLASMDREMDALKKEIDERQNHLFELNNHLARYHDLKSGLDNSRGTYDKLISSVQDVDLGKRLDQDSIAILENPTAAVEEKKNLAMGTVQASLLGLLLSIGIILLLSKSCKRFHTIDSVKQELGLPILGKILRDRGAALNRTVLDCDRNHLDFAESFRNLRSSLLNFPGEFTHKKCFAVTSALPNEGKSTVAMNIAIALAATNAKVLLIDGDLRHGQLCCLLKSEAGPGLADLITNRSPLNHVLHRTRMPNLTLLPAGPPLANVTEEMLRYGMDRLLQTLTQSFDYVILDTTPVLAADDAVTLAAKADWTMFVVRLGASRPSDSKRAIEELHLRQVNVAGVVVNSVPNRFTGHSYYRYYDHKLECKPFLELSS